MCCRLGIKQGRKENIPSFFLLFPLCFILMLYPNSLLLLTSLLLCWLQIQGSGDGRAKPGGWAEDDGKTERGVGSESMVMRRRPRRTRYCPLQPVVAKVVSVATVVLSSPGGLSRAVPWPPCSWLNRPTYPRWAPPFLASSSGGHLLLLFLDLRGCYKRIIIIE